MRHEVAWLSCPHTMCCAETGGREFKGGIGNKKVAAELSKPLRCPWWPTMSPKGKDDMLVPGDSLGMYLYHSTPLYLYASMPLHLHTSIPPCLQTSIP